MKPVWSCRRRCRHQWPGSRDIRRQLGSAAQTAAAAAGRRRLTARRRRRISMRSSMEIDSRRQSLQMWLKLACRAGRSSQATPAVCWSRVRHVRPWRFSSDAKSCDSCVAGCHHRRAKHCADNVRGNSGVKGSPMRNPPKPGVVAIPSLWSVAAIATMENVVSMPFGILRIELGMASSHLLVRPVWSLAISQGLRQV